MTSSLCFDGACICAAQARQRVLPLAALEELRSAERVVTSALTALECTRGLLRARESGRLSRAEELATLRLLDIAEATWDVHDLSERVLKRARAGFPAEPVRTLDALQLATALVFREALGPVALLTFDDRIRRNSAALGLSLLPALLT